MSYVYAFNVFFLFINYAVFVNFSFLSLSFSLKNPTRHKFYLYHKNNKSNCIIHLNRTKRTTRKHLIFYFIKLSLVKVFFLTNKQKTKKQQKYQFSLIAHLNNTNNSNMGKKKTNFEYAKSKIILHVILYVRRFWCSQLEF